MWHTRGIIWLELPCPGYQLGTLYVTYTRHYLTWAVMSRIPTWYSLCYLRETLFDQSWSPRLTAAATLMAQTRTQSWRRGHHLKTALLTLCERLLTSNCPRNCPKKLPKKLTLLDLFRNKSPFVQRYDHVDGLVSRRCVGRHPLVVSGPTTPCSYRTSFWSHPLC